VTKPSLYKTATNDHYTAILINNIFNFYSNNGDGSYNIYTGGSGFEYPKGSGLTASFEDGFVWGCYQNGEIKVGGSAYRHGLQAGPIITPGSLLVKPVAANPSDPRYRLYRVRPDINPVKTLADVQEILTDEEVPLMGRYETVTASSLYDQYIKDWNEWPADQGAPFIDNNHNNTYDPAIDIPGVKGASQTLWHVSNDLDSNKTKYMYGSLPIGLEFQRTIWAYKRKGVLDNTIFVRNLLINKSGLRLDSMYVAEWSDPDLGDAGDDLCGCDTSRDLGFIYNGRNSDSYFGTRVPSFGYQLLQGPIIAGTPTDTAFFCGRKIAGYRNQRMTAFNFFLGASAMYTDPTQGAYIGTIMMYRLLNGTISNTGAPYINPITGEPTPFAFTGDPVTKQGWLDGAIAPPGDRRMMDVSGPFTMMPNDTQDVIIAAVIAQAGDRLSSISYLRLSVDEIRTLYRSRFEPITPIAPHVSAPSLNEEIVLTWSDTVKTTEIESFNQDGYRFEGYNVYALPGPEFKDPVRLATYDLKDGIGYIRDMIFDETRNDFIEATVQWGTDEGLCRHYEMTTDSIAKKFIANYHTYYFAVSAYYTATQQDARPRSLESDPTIVAVTPRPPNPGVHWGTSYGDTVSVRHLSGKSDGLVTSLVIDPTTVTGHAYKITFDTTGDHTSWVLQDTTVNPPRTVLTNQTNFSNALDYPIVDGVQLRFNGRTTAGMKDWSSTGTRRWTWTNADSLRLEGFGGAMGWNEPSVIFHVNSQKTLKSFDIHRVQIKFADARSDTANNGYNFYAGWKPNSVPDDSFSYGYRYVAGGNLPARPEFTPYLVGKTQESWEFLDYKKGAVPFSAWDMETTPPMRLAIGFSENNTAGGLVDGRYWPPVGVNGQGNTRASGPQEWFFIFNKPYTDATPDPALQKNIVQNAMPIMWMGTVTRRLEDPYKSGDAIEIIPFYPFTVNDIYIFQTPASTNTVEQAIQDIDRINVFPNPYFGLQGLETSSYDQFITFTHLPRRAVIRIFTLSGWLIRTLVKDDPSSTMRWNLTNESNFSVAGGMYIAYIELPDFGKTRKLKFAVIIRTMVPEHY